jgi:branched-chain amino acid transport system permease protein
LTDLLQHAVDIVSLASLYALLALPVALIYGIMNLVNFAHGELIMIGGYALFLLGALALPVAVFIMLLAVVAAALAMERSAFRPVRGASAETLLVTSFAVSFLLQNVALVIFGSRPKSVGTPAGLNGAFEIGGVRIDHLDALTFGACVTCVVALAVFLRRTRFGIQMQAASEDFMMARLLGVRANSVIAAAFAISGALAGVAAFFLVVRGGSAYPTMGLAAVIIAFVATMMGGLGSLRGAIIGAAILGATTVLLDVVLPEAMRPERDAFLYGAVLLLLLIRPEGLSPAGRERV